MKTNLILGFFDGVHIAHRAVIASAVNYKDKLGSTAVLVTLMKSPASYFNNNIEYIYPREISLRKILNLGVDEIVELDFSDFVNMPAQDYLNFLYKKFKPITISTGFNHTFGYQKCGNANLLEQQQEYYGYKYICVEEKKVANEIVSSTNIKKYLKMGNIISANLLLGEDFSLSGKVIKGKQLGRTIGFPTANIEYPENIVKLPYGVYKSYMEIDGQHYDAITNWGIKPTVSNKAQPVIEVHVINYNKNLYGKQITIRFIRKIRDELQFKDINELKAQIMKDIDICSKL